METYKSAKEWFTAHNGAQVVKTVEGVAVDTDWPNQVADARRQLIEQGCDPALIVESEQQLQWPGGFMFRPRFKAREVGTLTVRSADYAFVPKGGDCPVYGDKKGAKVDGAGLVKVYPNGMIIRFVRAGSK